MSLFEDIDEPKERKRKNRKPGMKVSGKSVFVLSKAAAKIKKK